MPDNSYSTALCQPSQRKVPLSFLVHFCCTVFCPCVWKIRILFLRIIIRSFKAVLHTVYCMKMNFELWNILSHEQKLQQNTFSVWNRLHCELHQKTKPRQWGNKKKKSGEIETRVIKKTQIKDLQNRKSVTCPLFLSTILPYCSCRPWRACPYGCLSDLLQLIRGCSSLSSFIQDV